MDEEAEALTFITETLGDFVFSLDELHSELEHAPASLSSFFEQNCGNPKLLSQFLSKHGDRFFLENEKVAVFDPDLETVRGKAVQYFEEKLNLYGEPCHYMDYISCIGQAEMDVQNFIRCFYPGEAFKLFLLAHPRVFVLYEDDCVFLIENETVDFFEQCLEDHGEGLHYKKLLECIAQAPKHVVKFVNEYYSSENFLQLLEKNSDVFRIEDGCVFLRDHEI